MTDSTGAAATQADASAQPQAGTEQPQPQAGEGGESTSISLDEARQLRSENKSLRTRLRDLERTEQVRAEGETTELQKATERAAQLERDLSIERLARQDYSLRLETTAVARRLGFRDPELAHRLVPAADIEYDDAGAPRNVERILADLAKSHPYLTNGTADFGGGPRGSAVTGQQDMNSLIRRAAGRA
jgi:hypothetical protein